MTLICEECPLSKRCKYYGTSPLEIEGASIKCYLLSETHRSFIMQIPTDLVIDGNGKVIETRVTITPIKKSIWVRLLKR